MRKIWIQYERSMDSILEFSVAIPRYDMVVPVIVEVRFLSF
jgi:hypothetical protein